MELAQLTVLNQRYTIKRTLGQPGPYDITYLGQDVDSEKEYIVREFFPTHLADRKSEKTAVEIKGGDEETDLFDSGLEYFRKESEVLAELDHEALPSSYDLFEANGTFYRVRPHPPSMSLGKGLEDKGQLSEKAALTIMMPILEALHQAHENGLYHGGVSPRSIRLMEGGDVLLTGFRGAFFQLARESGNLSDLVQPGTSAVEQYTPRGQQGPWTDVYAAAATICQMVTGEELPESTDRLEGDDPLEELVQHADVFSSPGVREALVDALAVDPSQRLQSIEALMNVLTESSTRYDEGDASYSIIPVEPDTGEEDGEEEVEVLSTRAEDRAAQAPARSDDGSMSRTALMIGVPVLVLLLGGGAWFMMSGGTSSATGSTYKDMRERADSLFQEQEYQRAEFFYNEALSMRKDDQYVQERLAKLEELQGGELYERHMNRGNQLLGSADSLYEEGDLGGASRQYSKALASFYSAQDANPDGEEAQARIEEIEARQEEIAKRQVGGDEGDESGGGTVSLDQLAQVFKEQAARQLEAGNLLAALNKYKQAKEYQPDDPSLNRAIADLKEQIDQQEKERKFQERYSEGKRLIREGKYKAAKSAFQEAMSVMEEPRAQAALARADSLMQVKTQRTEKYERFRTTGDSLLEASSDASSLKDAIAAYRKALQIRPDDEYVKNRIDETEREIEQMKLAEQEMEQQEEKRKEIIDEEGVYTVTDQEPEVKGGLRSLVEDATYPDQARRQGVEGRVFVRVTVNKDGSVRDVNVLRGPEAGLKNEARRVVRNAEFIPGKYNGESVPSRTTIFIPFKLDN